MPKRILTRQNGMPLIKPYPVYYKSQYYIWGDLTTAIKSLEIDISEIPAEYLVEVILVTRADNGDTYSLGLKKIEQRIMINDEIETSTAITD